MAADKNNFETLRQNKLIVFLVFTASLLIVFSLILLIQIDGTMYFCDTKR